jgi:hypothetical protein
LHKYLYTHADPVNGIDPSGEFLIGFGIGMIANSSLVSVKNKKDINIGAGAISTIIRTVNYYTWKILPYLGYAIDSVLYLSLINDYLMILGTSYSVVTGRGNMKDIKLKYSHNPNILKKLDEISIRKTGNMSQQIANRIIRMGYYAFKGKLDFAGFCTAWVDVVHAKLPVSDNEMTIEKIVYYLPEEPMQIFTIHAFIRITIKEPGKEDFIFLLDNGYIGGADSVCYPSDVPQSWGKGSEYKHVSELIQ